MYFSLTVLDIKSQLVRINYVWNYNWSLVSRISISLDVLALNPVYLWDMPTLFRRLELYLFHGGGMQNPHYPLLSTNAVQFMSAASLRSTSSTPASSTSSGEIGRTLRQDFFWKYGGTVSLLVEKETVAHGTPLRKS